MKRSTDTIPAMLTPGEQVASNGALALMGRDIIPAANQAALAMKETPMNTLPRLGSAPNMTGIQRQGNAFSHIPGIVMPSGAPASVQTQYSAPSAQVLTPPPAMRGYADGTLSEQGALPMPGILDTFQNILNTQPPKAKAKPKRAPGDSAPTLEQAKGNYDLQAGKPQPAHYAIGSQSRLGAGNLIDTFPADPNRLGFQGVPANKQMVPGPKNLTNPTTGQGYEAPKTRGARPMSAEAVNYLKSQEAPLAAPAPSAPVKSMGVKSVGRGLGTLGMIGGAAQLASQFLPQPKEQPVADFIGNAVSKGLDLAGNAVTGALNYVGDHNSGLRKALDSVPALHNLNAAAENTPAPVAALTTATPKATQNQTLLQKPVAGVTAGSTPSTTKLVANQSDNFTPIDMNAIPSKVSDSGIPYNPVGNKTYFTNRDGSGKGSITEHLMVNGGLPARMNDGKGSLSVMKLESPYGPGGKPEIDSMAAVRQQLMRQALTAPNAATQDIGDFLAAKSRQKAAQQGLAMDQGQQKIDADIAGNKATAEAAANKAMLDYGVEQQKLGIEQQKADSPLLNSRKLYNDLGQVTGEVTDVIDRKTGQPMQNQSNEARFQSALETLLNEPSLSEAKRIEAIKKLREVHRAQSQQPA